MQVAARGRQAPKLWMQSSNHNIQCGDSLSALLRGVKIGFSVWLSMDAGLKKPADLKKRLQRCREAVQLAANMARVQPNFGDLFFCIHPRWANRGPYILSGRLGAAIRRV